MEAIKLGAVDFFEKPFSPEALQARIGQLHRIWKLNRENRQLKERLEQRFDYSALVLIPNRCGFEDVGDRVVNPASGKLSRQPKTVPEATTEFIHSVLKGTLYLQNQTALKVLGNPASLTHKVSKGSAETDRELLVRNF